MRNRVRAALLIATGVASAVVPVQIADANDPLVLEPPPSSAQLEVSVSVPGRPGGGGGRPSGGRPSYRESGNGGGGGEAVRVPSRPVTYCPGITGADGFRCQPIATPGVPAPPPPPPPDPADLAQIARELLPVRMPTPHTSPTETGFQLTPFETWLYLDAGAWVPVQATVELDGVSATVTAKPDRMKWEMGDGKVVECSGPGEARQQGASAPCGHRYSVAGQYSVLVTVTWKATWTSNTGAAGTQADVLTSAAIGLEVRSGQAVTD